MVVEKNKIYFIDELSVITDKNADDYGAATGSIRIPLKCMRVKFSYKPRIGIFGRQLEFVGAASQCTYVKQLRRMVEDEVSGQVSLHLSNQMEGSTLLPNGAA